MTPPLLSIRDVHVDLGGNSILQGLSAEIARGQITALIGPNGCGKTTLLRSILKEVPYRGEFRFRSIGIQRRSDRLGRQGAALPEDLQDGKFRVGHRLGSAWHGDRCLRSKQ